MLVLRALASDAFEQNRRSKADFNANQPVGVVTSDAGSGWPGRPYQPALDAQTR